MNNRRNIAGFNLAIAAAALFPSLAMSDQDVTQQGTPGRCVGANACQGQSACKSSTNACKGQNACQGNGFVVVYKKQDCIKPGTHFEALPAVDGTPVIKQKTSS